MPSTCRLQYVESLRQVVSPVLPDLVFGGVKPFRQDVFNTCKAGIWMEMSRKLMLNDIRLRFIYFSTRRSNIRQQFRVLCQMENAVIIIIDAARKFHLHDINQGF